MTSPRLIATSLCVAATCVASTFGSAQQTSQVELNHMRWNNHNAVIAHSIAWQEQREGHWVTVVLLTDRAVPRTAVVAGKSASDLMTEAKTQGVAFVVMTGGVPLPQPSFEVGYRNGGEIRTVTANGAGGFDIEIQSATQLKGRVVFHPFTAGSKDESAWSIVFDAPVLRGDAKRMAAEGEALGAGGGAAGKDLLALQQAKFAMDFAALSALGSSDLTAFLADSGARAKNLAMLKSMTSPQSRVLGGLRSGEKALVYWAQLWPAALNNRCIETMELRAGRWRSIESACQPE